MIWTKHILSEFLKVFLLVFFALFFLATLIDFSAHMKTFCQEGISPSSIALYYLAQMSRQGEIFLCTALLLANIKVLSQSSVRGEVTALCTAGVPLRRLTYPLLFTAFVAMGLLYINGEWMQPSTSSYLCGFEESFFKDTGKDEEVLALLLEDQTQLLYSRFDAETQRFEDVFWVKDLDHIVHMGELAPFERLGFEVSTLARQGSELVRTDFQPSLSFPEMSFERRSLSQATLPIDWQPLSQLRHHLPDRWRHLRDYEAKAATLFLQRVTTPLLALLVFLVPLPYCLQFGRNRQLFWLYTFSLVGFLSYMAATQAFAILGKSSVLSPFLVVPLLPLVALIVGGVRYAKL